MWPGTAKLAEEAGEVVQVIGKLIATGGRTDHWSGRDLKVDLEDEIADVIAAAWVVVEWNRLDSERMKARSIEKYALFGEWHDR